MLGSQLTLSISIVTFNPQIPLLQDQANSLLAAVEVVGLKTVEVTYILNGDETPAQLENALPWLALQKVLHKVSIIKNDQNLGYGRAHNQAILTSRAPYYLVLNPDVILHKNALIESVSYLYENPQTVALSPRTLDDKGEKQYLAKRYPTLLDFILRGFAPASIRALFTARLSRYEYRGETEAEIVPNIKIMSGCFMFCRTDTLQKVEGFDDYWFLYFEDFDLSLRLNHLGQLDYVPQVEIIHAGGYAAKKGLLHLRLFIASAIKFFHRHGWQLW